MKKILSFDAETNGLWGEIFAIGAIVYGVDGQEITRFIGRCPIEGKVNEWVQDNVLPQIKNMEQTHSSRQELLAEFAKFYLANKADADIVVHMGVPVESNLIKEMHSTGLIKDWDAPFPLLDIAGCLAQVGENPLSVDEYVDKYNIKVKKISGSHHPLMDSEIAARVYQNLLKRRQK